MILENYVSNALKLVWLSIAACATISSTEILCHIFMSHIFKLSDFAKSDFGHSVKNSLPRMVPERLGPTVFKPTPKTRLFNRNHNIRW